MALDAVAGRSSGKSVHSQGAAAGSGCRAACAASLLHNVRHSGYRQLCPGCQGQPEWLEAPLPERGPPWYVLRLLHFLRSVAC